MGSVPTNEKAVDRLNSFLRGELSAIETYKQAMEKIVEPSLVSQMHDCMQSHQERAQLLRQRVIQLGGLPSTDSGPWGAFAKLVAGGAAALGVDTAIAALEEGEDHGLRDYRADLSDLDMESRTLIEEQILPAEQRTHRVMSSLKHGLQRQV